MTLAKYNEIMDQIKMSDEMQSRILSNVDQKMAKKKRKHLYRIWFPVIGVAAAAAILLLIAKPWSGRSTVQSTEGTTSSVSPIVTGGVTTGGTETGTEGDMYPGAYQMKEFTSAAELGQAAGFPIKDLTAIPFKVSSKEYRLISGTLAEEEYNGKDVSLSFRKSKGKEDNSGVYEEYKVTKNADVDGAKITLEGEAKLFHLIRWTKDGFAYSLYSPEGISEDAALALVKESISE